jgi:flagellar protein FlgJ
MANTVNNIYQLQYNNKFLDNLKHRAEKSAVNTDNGKKIDQNSKLFKVCREFEAIFIKQMLDVMRKTVVKNDFFHGGFTEEVFEDMLYDDYAKKMAENGHFGLSDMLYKQLSPQ